MSLFFNMDDSGLFTSRGCEPKTTVIAGLAALVMCGHVTHVMKHCPPLQAGGAAGVVYEGCSAPGLLPPSGQGSDQIRPTQPFNGCQTG